jgi:hypothetical protein
METRCPCKIFRWGLLFFAGSETVRKSDKHAQIFISQA